MDRGVVVEVGTHDEAAMARQGHYWRLYEAQARRTESDEDGGPNDQVLLAHQIPQPRPRHELNEPEQPDVPHSEHAAPPPPPRLHAQAPRQRPPGSTPAPTVLPPRRHAGARLPLIRRPRPACRW